MSPVTPSNSPDDPENGGCLAVRSSNCNPRSEQALVARRVPSSRLCATLPQLIAAISGSLSGLFQSMLQGAWRAVWPVIVAPAVSVCSAPAMSTTCVTCPACCWGGVVRQRSWLVMLAQHQSPEMSQQAGLFGMAKEKNGVYWSSVDRHAECAGRCPRADRDSAASRACALMP